jgi:orotidine-5'-phosphate decarboxylase
MSEPRIIVALDYAQTNKAMELVNRLDPKRCRLKVGKELFTRGGPTFVEDLVSLGYDVFLDLKFHDIPNTVAKACAAATELGVWMVNVHALGGRRMMEAARESVDSYSHSPHLIAVTILTSMSQADLNEIGLPGTAEDNVLRLAHLSKEAGMDGVVCSPREVSLIKDDWNDACVVTPGIRPQWAQKGDQARVMMPSEALNAGASYLVIGRPITEADEPLEALDRIESEIFQSIT